MSGVTGKYPSAKPGALGSEPLKAALRCGYAAPYGPALLVTQDSLLSSAGRPLADASQTGPASRAFHPVPVDRAFPIGKARLSEYPVSQEGCWAALARGEVRP
jgi:hypothetical protein